MWQVLNGRSRQRFSQAMIEMASDDQKLHWGEKEIRPPAGYWVARRVQLSVHGCRPPVLHFPMLPNLLKQDIITGLAAKDSAHERIGQRCRPATPVQADTRELQSGLAGVARTLDKHFAAQ